MSRTSAKCGARSIAGRLDTFGSCADYKTLNKITSESRFLFLRVRSDGRVAMDDTDNDEDERSDEGNARGKGRRWERGEGEMPATRCRHVAEERDGACLFKPILYRIFILMDFFNSGYSALRVFVLWLWPGKRTRNAMISARSDDGPSPSLLPDYHTRVSITVRISTPRDGPSRAVEECSRFLNSAWLVRAR